jgi:hypothetical protein
VFVKIGLDERKKRAGVRKLSRRTNSSYGQEQRSRVRWDDAARQRELWPMRLRHAGLNLAERPCETAFFSGTAQCPISRQRDVESQ